MVILEDTRQQAAKHENKHSYFASEGITIVRSKLPFGDYALWGGTISVDTKASVEEIAANIGQVLSIWNHFLKRTCCRHQALWIHNAQ